MFFHHVCTPFLKVLLGEFCFTFCFYFLFFSANHRAHAFYCRIQCFRTFSLFGKLDFSRKQISESNKIALHVCIDFSSKMWLFRHQFPHRFVGRLVDSKLLQNDPPKFCRGMFYFSSFSQPVPKVDFWMHFGRPLAHFWLPCASLWRSFLEGRRVGWSPSIENITWQDGTE